MTDNQGWIKLHKQIIGWEWYSDVNVCRVFIHLLLKANFEEKQWRGRKIKRGQFVTGRKKLSQEVTLSEQQTRTALNKLKSTNEITIESTNEYSVIAINNYTKYQQSNQRGNQRATNEQPTDNQRITTTKEDKKIRRKEEEKKRGRGSRKNNSPLKEKELQTILEFFNTTFDRQYKSVKAWKENASYWLEDYSIEDIKQAIANWRKYGWWTERGSESLTLLFRRQNKNGTCDYIGELLSKGKK